MGPQQKPQVRGQKLATRRLRHLPFESFLPQRRSAHTPGLSRHVPTGSEVSGAVGAMKQRVASEAHVPVDGLAGRQTWRWFSLFMQTSTARSVGIRPSVITLQPQSPAAGGGRGGGGDGAGGEIGGGGVGGGDGGNGGDGG